jgi:hypothetical protein
MADISPASVAAVDITAASWVTGDATFTTALPHGIAVGASVTITGVNPAGYNGTYTTLAGTAGSTVVVAIATSPGAYVSGGVITPQHLPIDPGGNTPAIVVNPGTVIPGEPREKTAGTFPFTLVLPTFAWLPLVQGVKFNASAVPPWNATTPGTTNPAPPPPLTMTRTPAFPAYPS